MTDPRPCTVLRSSDTVATLGPCDAPASQYDNWLQLFSYPVTLALLDGLAPAEWAQRAPRPDTALLRIVIDGRINIDHVNALVEEVVLLGPSRHFIVVRTQMGEVVAIDTQGAVAGSQASNGDGIARLTQSEYDAVREYASELVED